MGSSFVAFRGRGFWARDALLEVWLHVLGTAVEAETEAPDWLRRAREDWLLQAHVGLMGCISPRLDEHVGADPARVARLLPVCHRARDRLAAWAPVVPKEVLNSFGTGGEGGVFLEDVEVEVFLSVVDAFVALVVEPSSSHS